MYIPLPILLVIAVALGAWLHSRGTLKVPLALRAWWWGHLAREPENMPRDVREYILRRNLKATITGTKTFEEKRALSTKLMAGVLQLDADQIGAELRDEIVAASMKLLDGIPMGKCATCTGAVFLHEAIDVNGTIYCKGCAERRAGTV